MSSSTLRRSGPAPGSAVLPIDALFEILILLPAKDLCRLRAVCRTWRSLLSNPQFIAAHAARHRRLLFFAGHDKSYRDEGVLCDIIDLSGRVIKRIPSIEHEWVVSAQHDLACIAKGTSKSCKLLNLATGEVFSLPEELSKEHTPRKMNFLNCRTVVALGQAATGEYKLLRVIHNGHFRNPYVQLCEIFTVSGSRDAQWRGTGASPHPVDMCPLSRVALDGIVYFFFDDDFVRHAVGRKRIASFDLLTEEWRAILRGPAPILVEGRRANNAKLSLAALNGSLVLVHHVLNASMDLWFLMDFEKGLWNKQYTIQVHLVSYEYFAHPLVILNDGRIVIYIGSGGLLRIYNPRRQTYTNVAEMGPRVGIGLYTGNLLSLGNGVI